MSVWRSAELEEWVNTQKAALYDGRVADIITELEQRLEHLDPRQVSVRKRLAKIREYLTKRQAKMDYKRLREEDLEIALIGN